MNEQQRLFLAQARSDFAVEDLAPALAQEGPNPEYPWPRANPQTAPAEHPFRIWAELRDTSRGRQFLELLGALFATAEAYL